MISVTISVSFILSGCSTITGRGSVIERPSKEQLTMGLRDEVYFDPVLYPDHQTLTYNNITIEVQYTPKSVLQQFFSDEKIFGKYAGENPYPEELIVFYTKISNMGTSTIHVDPVKFILQDDFFSQYNYLTPDYISALYENRGSLFGFAKTTAQAAPGIYGAGIGALGVLGSNFSWKRYYLIKRVTLTGGYVHTGVIYDGYICFLNPHKNAQQLTLVIPNIRYDFDANEEARDSLEFRFNFSIQPR